MAVPPDSARARSRARARATEAVRAAALPVLAGTVLLALLSGWVATGGLGTLARVHLQISGAVVPVPATPEATAAYLTIRNTGAEADQLLSVTTDSARSSMLADNATSDATSGTMVAVPQITVPAHGSVALGPFADDIMLMQPARLTVGQTVVLVLDFRVVGRITVNAEVVPVGSS